MIPVCLYTNHGVFELWGDEKDTLGKVLKNAGVPLSAVFTYVVSETRLTSVSSSLSSPILHFISVNELLRNIAKENNRIIAHLSRNIALPSLLTNTISGIRQVKEPVTEWIFPDIKKGAFQKNLSQLSASECLEIVIECVKEVLKNWPRGEKRRMIIGVSGGGDSNVLLSALLKSRLVEMEDIFPVMMLGIPDQERLKKQAEEMCYNLGLKIEFVEPQKVAQIINVHSLQELFQQFTKEYPKVDLEFLGTFLIRQTLSFYAQLYKVKYVALGLNREDLLSESIVRICQGKLPLPMPFRKIGAITFVYPIWNVPKKIGDGAFPRFSLVNYENRDPSYSEGRCLYYYISYMLSEIAPGLDVSLLKGFSKLALMDKAPIRFDKELNDVLLKNGVTSSQLKKWKDFLGLMKK